MTQVAIQAQVDAIKKATEKALKSRETALKFLMDAGIVSGKDKNATASKQVKKK